jgi:hypothetical protein
MLNKTIEIVKQCKCYPSPSQIKKATKEAEEFVKTGEDMKTSVEAAIGDFVQTFNKVARDHKERELQMTYKFYDFLERQAINVAGCDAACVDACTNPVNYTLHQVPECISRCECTGGAI